MFDHDLSNAASLFVRCDGALGENFVANLKGKGVRLLAVDKFAMHRSVLMCEDLEHFARF